MSSAWPGLAPREGLESLLVKMGRTGPLAEPHRGLQAGKSRDPHSQNADIIFCLCWPCLGRKPGASPRALVRGILTLVLMPRE